MNLMHILTKPKRNWNNECLTFSLALQQSKLNSITVSDKDAPNRLCGLALPYHGRARIEVVQTWSEFQLVAKGIA